MKLKKINIWIEIKIFRSEGRNTDARKVALFKN